jgi:hypothetical protein
MVFYSIRDTEIGFKKNSRQCHLLEKVHLLHGKIFKSEKIGPIKIPVIAQYDKN